MTHFKTLDQSFSSMEIEDDRKITYMYTNIETISTTRRYNEFVLQAKLMRPHFIILTGTGLSGKISDLEICKKLENYSVFRKDRPEDRTVPCGGLAVFVYKNDKIIIDITHKFDTTPVESFWLNVRIGSTKIMLAVVFRSSDTKLEYNEKLIQSIDDGAKYCKQKNKKLIIFGGFNYPKINWEKEPNEYSASYYFHNMILQNNLHQLVKEKTHFKAVTPNIIDLIITNDNRFFSSPVSYPPIGGSSHVVLLTRSCLPEGEHIKNIVIPVSQEILKDKKLKKLLDNKEDSFNKYRDSLPQNEFEHYKSECKKLTSYLKSHKFDIGCSNKSVSK